MPSFIMNTLDRQNSRRLSSAVLFVTLILAAPSHSAAEDQLPLKSTQVFYTPERRRRLVENAEKYEWARELRDKILKRADRWLDVPDEEVWKMMFGPEPCRAGMVNKGEGCPVCGKEKVYEYPAWYQEPWICDPWKHPWKVICPNCGETWPKNDFEPYYKSGIGNDGFFHFENADRSLLFNTDHPDPKDPKHMWEVDSADCLPREEMRKKNHWIGFYLIRGVWYNQIGSGIDDLSWAYFYTDDIRYAHKCAILLDRVADTWPELDGSTQQWHPNWHNYAGGYVYFYSQPAKRLALAYDRIWDAMERDPELVPFLKKKSEQYEIPLPKNSVADIRRNIEDRIIRDSMNSPRKMSDNGTRTHGAIAMMTFVLEGPAALGKVIRANADRIFMKQCVHEDGSGGERAIAYDLGSVGYLCQFLDYVAMVSPEALTTLFERIPRAREALYFPIRLQCLGHYKPNIGDARSTGFPNVRAFEDVYARFFHVTADPLMAQWIAAMHKNLDDLHLNPWQEGCNTISEEIRKVVADKGPLDVGSWNFPDYSLVILRGGQGEHRRVAWLDYDSRHGTSSHAHCDGMNLGLMAKGLDLIPDLGYPERTGGWPSRRQWTSHTRSHATVLVDDHVQERVEGKLSIKSFGPEFQVVRAEAPAMYAQTTVYERNFALVEVSPENAYVVDVFRVAGGNEHVYNIHGAESEFSSQGIHVQGSENIWNDRLWDVGTDPNPQPGWIAQWRMKDSWGVLSGQGPAKSREEAPLTDVLLRMHCLTPDAAARIGTGAARGPYKPFMFSTELTYAQMVRHAEGDKPVSSVFVTVLEPCKGPPFIKNIERIPLGYSRPLGNQEAAVGVRVEFENGMEDLVLLNPPDDTGAEEAAAEGKPQEPYLNGAAALVRKRGKNVEKAILIAGKELKIEQLQLLLKEPAERVTVKPGPDGTPIIKGTAHNNVATCTID